MIEIVNVELASLRAKYAGSLSSHSFPTPDGSLAPVEVDYSSQERQEDDERDEKLRSQLKSLVMSQLTHQRSAHPCDS
jgi:hypothetical protein